MIVFEIWGRYTWFVEEEGVLVRERFGLGVGWDSERLVFVR